eukprot:752700-Hanusia_phi.AAC.1
MNCEVPGDGDSKSRRLELIARAGASRQVGLVVGILPQRWQGPKEYRTTCGVDQKLPRSLARLQQGSRCVQGARSREGTAVRRGEEKRGEGRGEERKGEKRGEGRGGKKRREGRREERGGEGFSFHLSAS